MRMELGMAVGMGRGLLLLRIRAAGMVRLGRRGLLMVLLKVLLMIVVVVVVVALVVEPWRWLSFCAACQPCVEQNSSHRWR
jgi:hypothetical protein